MERTVMDINLVKILVFVRNGLGWAFLLSVSSVLLDACELSQLDQVRLIQLSRRTPTMLPIELGGAEVRCTDIDFLTIVHPKDTSFCFLLVRDRKFERWIKTPAYYPFSIRLVLSTFLQTAQFNAEETLLRYGAGSGENTSRNQAILDAADSLVWSSVQLLDEATFQRIVKTVIPIDLKEEIRLNVEAVVKNLIKKEALAFRSIVSISAFSTVASTVVRVVASIAFNRRFRSITLEVPVDSSGPPYAGMPRLLDRDLK